MENVAHVCYQHRINVDAFPSKYLETLPLISFQASDFLSAHPPQGNKMDGLRMSYTTPSALGPESTQRGQMASKRTRDFVVALITIVGFVCFHLSQCLS